MEKIYSPYDQSVLSEIAFKSSVEIEELFENAVDAHQSWLKTNKLERLQVIKKFNSYLLEHKNEIGKLISIYMGRPIRFSPKEVETAVKRSEEVLSVFEKFNFVEEIDHQRKIHHLPLGNILIFGAWNYPVLTAINSIVPAILAGNAVSFRPSIQTFFMGKVFLEAFEFANLPKNIFQVAAFSHEDTKEIVQSKNIHGIVYTGSTEGGRKIHTWAAGNFIPVTMELGGKDAAYIRADADVKNSAINVADGAFFNSGQSCCAVERVYVHESIFNETLALIKQEAKALVLGDPLSPETTLGPMAKKNAVEFLLNQLNEAKKQGAKTHLDELGPIHLKGQFIRPELLTNCSPNFQIQQEETFGPFVTITPVKSDEEAIKLINDSKFGLTASIWTTDTAMANEIAPKLEVGVVLVNRCDYVDPKLPWRGEKDTGMGQALGPDCFSSYLKPRSVFHN